MRPFIRACGLIVIAAWALRAPAFGQGTFSADRPGASTPPYIVPQFSLQLETGFAFDLSHQGGATTRSYSWNQSLFRFGLLPFAEVRVAAYYVKTESIEASGTSTANGFGPLGLGTKIVLGKEKGLRPEIALMANVLLPKTGLEAYRVKNAAPSVFLLFQNSLTRALSLNPNIGLIWDGESHTPSTFFAVNLGLNVSTKWQCYVESYGTFHPAGNAFFVDGGLAYLLTPRMQLDLSGGISTKGGKRDEQVSAGFSWLIF